MLGQRRGNVHAIRKSSPALRLNTALFMIATRRAGRSYTATHSEPSIGSCSSRSLLAKVSVWKHLLQIRRAMPGGGHTMVVQKSALLATLPARQPHVLRRLSRCAV